MNGATADSTIPDMNPGSSLSILIIVPLMTVLRTIANNAISTLNPTPMYVSIVNLSMSSIGRNSFVIRLLRILATTPVADLKNKIAYTSTPAAPSSEKTAIVVNVPARSSPPQDLNSPAAANKTIATISSIKVAIDLNTRSTISDTLNNVIDTNDFSGSFGDFDAPNISQNPVIGSATIISVKMLIAPNDISTSSTVPAENKMIAIINSIEAPVKWNLSANPPGA